MRAATIFMAIALTARPAPAENYYSWVSPEIADVIQECVIDGEYREYLDFNGDGNLNIADVVGVLKRYQDNCTYGNTITLDSKVIDSIITENYTEAAVYYEINGNPAQYELTAREIMTAEIYIEFENGSDIVEVELNPYTEAITVIN